MRIIFFIGAVDFLLSSIGYLYYRQNLPWGKSPSFALFYLLLAANAVLSRALSPALPHFLVKISAWAEGLWLAFSYYTLLFAALHFLFWLAGKLFSYQLPSEKIALIGMACIVLCVGFGSWRAFQPEIRTEKLLTKKLPPDASYRIALVSDVHLGRILGRSYAEKLAERLNELQPDMVLIAGDLIDEKIAYVQEEDSLSALKKIRAPKGIYLAFGNHDYIDDASLWQEMAEACGINVLRDRSVLIDGRVKITGLNDFSRNRDNISLRQLARNNERYYSIILDHQPRKMRAAAASGYDLYLAGHTHTGQLFPNRLVTRRMYELDYGSKDFASLHAITCAGYGFWGPPVRTEKAPEIVLIEVRGR